MNTRNIIPRIDEVKTYLLKLQKHLCAALSESDGKQNFATDRWQRTEGGGGITRTLSDGNVFEKAGVNFSHIYGNQLPPAARGRHINIAERNCGFEALGVSVVAHPLNPYVPTTHCNIRFFLTQTDPPVWWFGGGYDLTPYYPFFEDAITWHRAAYAACQPFGTEVYPRYKKWCDDYFFLKHRNETRGIGGLFFDELNAWGFPVCFKFIQSVGGSFLPAYLAIVKRHIAHPYTEHERWFQRYRRGRYVEFNLIYDRGTLFGLQSGGRSESMLMSLPPQAIWHYDWKPAPGSAEESLYLNYLQPRDWLKTENVDAP